ncbi:hypothetical protein [Streptomyces sp. NPDC059744]
MQPQLTLDARDEAHDLEPALDRYGPATDSNHLPNGSGKCRPAVK